MFGFPLRQRREASVLFVLILLTTLMLPGVAVAQPDEVSQRPMNFMDVQLLKSAGSWAPSPDGEWLLYTVSTPDWEEADRQSDVHLVSLREGGRDNLAACAAFLS